MIDRHAAWIQFVQNARLYLQANRTFYSRPDEAAYSIAAVDGDIIHVNRFDGATVTIGTVKFNTAIQRVNDASGIVAKKGMYRGQVVTETTIVELLPELLQWFGERGNLYIAEIENASVLNTLPTASTSEETAAEAIWHLAEQRRGQRALRLRLIYLQQGRCGISGCRVLDTLHASHLIPYAISRSQRVDNAILLRADLHELLDSHLLGIEPVTMTVHISPGVNDEYYQSLNGIRVRDRIGNEPIALASLVSRWEMYLNRR
jgi:hypothetical protein